jgi:hypothetical protein
MQRGAWMRESCPLPRGSGGGLGVGASSRSRCHSHHLELFAFADTAEQSCEILTRIACARAPHIQCSSRDALLRCEPS